jgi:hypothetical protein
MMRICLLSNYYKVPRPSKRLRDADHPCPMFLILVRHKTRNKVRNKVRPNLLKLQVLKFQVLKNQVALSLMKNQINVAKNQKASPKQALLRLHFMLPLEAILVKLVVVKISVFSYLF